MTTSIRLRQVALVATSLDRVLDDLHAVFGLQVAHRDPGVEAFGLENAVLPVGGQFLEVVAPTRPGTAAGRYLERRGGDGGYMVITECDDHVGARARVAAMGIRTVLDLEDHGYHCLQLHPADTGGSFLEIDHQDGSAGTYGPWAPAGAFWEAAAVTAIVDGIRAVEVQSDRPGELVARWAEILDVERSGGEGLEGDGDDGADPSLMLDDALVRFPPAADGRGEGLGAVELSAVDPEVAMATATAKGLVDDGVIVIGGTRFTLWPSGGAGTRADRRRELLLEDRSGDVL